MKINWKLRLQNKVTLLAIVMGIIPFIYQVLALLGVTPSVTEGTITDLAIMLINILVLFGVVVDPTTSGVSDSDTAMGYSNPKEEINTIADDEEVK